MPANVSAGDCEQFALWCFLRHIPIARLGVPSAWCAPTSAPPKPGCPRFEIRVPGRPRCPICTCDTEFIQRLCKIVVSTSPLMPHGGILTPGVHLAPVPVNATTVTMTLLQCIKMTRKIVDYMARLSSFETLSTEVEVTRISFLH